MNLILLAYKYLQSLPYLSVKSDALNLTLSNQARHLKTLTLARLLTKI